MITFSQKLQNSCILCVIDLPTLKKGEACPLSLGLGLWPEYNINQGYYSHFRIMSIKKVADRCKAIKKEDLFLNLSLLATSSSLITKGSQPGSLELRFSVPQSCRPKQKKLNSSIRRAETDRTYPPQILKKTQSLYVPVDFKASKKAQFSIVKTLSLCYVSQFKTISKRIPYKTKLDIPDSSQPSKDIGYDNYDVDQKYVKMNTMVPKAHQLKELIYRNRNLMSVNQALLKGTQVLQQEIVEYEIRLAEKIEILQFQQKINKELTKQMDIMVVYKNQSEGKLVNLLKVNEQLARQSNRMKQKIKENMKDIRMIRGQMGVQQSEHHRSDIPYANN